MEYKKPTLEELKAYFKNTKEVKCLYIGKTVKLIENGNIDLYVNDIWWQYDRNKYVLVWKKSKGYAEIQSYKEEPIDGGSCINDFKTPQHYDNSKGSIYQFCENQNLNSYEFDIIKRVVRSRKKGNFKEDLEKTKHLIDLYLKEYEEIKN